MRFVAASGEQGFYQRETCFCRSHGQRSGSTVLPPARGQPLSALPRAHRGGREGSWAPMLGAQGKGSHGWGNGNRQTLASGQDFKRVYPKYVHMNTVMSCETNLPPAACTCPLMFWAGRNLTQSEALGEPTRSDKPESHRRPSLWLVRPPTSGPPRIRWL